VYKLAIREFSGEPFKHLPKLREFHASLGVTAPRDPVERPRSNRSFAFIANALRERYRTALYFPL
jgi:hypothetical protein